MIQPRPILRTLLLSCRRRAYLVLWLLAALLLHVSAIAAPSFEGKHIVVIVSSASGGGTDTTARLIGRSLARYLPGHPTLVFQNMPGAGGINALNNFYQRAEPDGLTLFAGAGNELSPTTLQRTDIVKYDPRKLMMIGGFANDSSFLLLRPNARARLADASAAPVVMAEIDGTRSSAQMAIWGAEALHWNVRWVLGYAGTADMLLALERGEADMAANNVLSSVRKLVKADEATVFVQTGMLQDGKVVRSSLFPDAPVLSELVEPKLTGEALRAFIEWQREAQLGKWFALPPDTPAPIVDAYRRAYERAFADPDFRQAAAKELRPDFKPLSVADLKTIVDALVGTAPETLDYVLGLRKKYGL